MEIDTDTSSWEEVSNTYLEENKIENNKRRKAQKESKIKKLHQILFVLDSLKKMKRYIKTNSNNIYDRYNQIIHKNGNYEKTNLFLNLFKNNKINKENNKNEIIDDKEPDSKLEKDISLFLSLIMNNINSRLYIVLNKNIESFIEYKLGKEIIEHNKLYDGNIFSIDEDLEIKDQTIAFSKKSTHYKFFLTILEIINKLYCRKENNKFNVFSELDEKRIKKISNNKNIIKIHPLYAIDSLCRKNEFIYPRHPILGMINNEKIFKREMCNKLKTERGWYMNGRTLKFENNKVKDNNYMAKPPKPYRIVKKKLYAEFQTIKIEIEGLKDNFMDYFHENFIPIDCKYLLCNGDFCKKLKVKFSECVVGFKYKERVIKGVFIYEKNYDFVKTMYEDYIYYMNIIDFNKNFEKMIKEWKILIRKLKRYHEIRKYVGL